MKPGSCPGHHEPHLAMHELSDVVTYSSLCVWSNSRSGNYVSDCARSESRLTFQTLLITFSSDSVSVSGPSVVFTSTSVEIVSLRANDAFRDLVRTSPLSLACYFTIVATLKCISFSSTLNALRQLSTILVHDCSISSSIFPGCYLSALMASLNTMSDLKTSVKISFLEISFRSITS